MKKVLLLALWHRLHSDHADDAGRRPDAGSDRRGEHARADRCTRSSYSGAEAGCAAARPFDRRAVRAGPFDAAVPI